MGPYIWHGGEIKTLEQQSIEGSTVQAPAKYGRVGKETSERRSEHIIIGAENGTPLRDSKVRTRERCVRVFHKLLKPKSSKLDSTVIDPLPPRPLELSLGDGPSLKEMIEVIRVMPIWKAVGPDGLPAELLKLDHPGVFQWFHHIFVNVWITEELSQQWKHAIIKILRK